jgi:thymidylate synthase
MVLVCIMVNTLTDYNVTRSKVLEKKNIVMNIEHDYLKLLKDVLENGKEKEDRTGTGTISVFGRQIRHDMSRGFPLLTTKKMYWKGIVTELLWFLRGDTNIKFLVDNDCHIWDGDAYKNFQINCDESYGPYGVLLQSEFINKIKTDDEFAKKWGELGPIYGKQWRGWGGNIKRLTYGFIDKNDDGWVMRWSDLHSFGHGTHWCYTPIKNSDTINDSDIGKRVVFDFEADHENFNPLKYAIINTDTKDEYENHIDQIKNLIEQLKTNPDSRRLMVNAWNVGELDQMTLPPCHYGFQVYTRELSLEEKEWQLEKTNCINDIENDRIIYGHEWENYIQEQYESIQSTQGIKIPTRAISLMWNQRSVDTFLGLPFNIASYGLLLEIIAKEVNMVPDELIGNLGDVHLYKNHIEQAKEQLTREPKRLPTLEIIEREEQNFSMDEMYIDNFQFPNYQSHPSIKAPLNN